MSTVLKILTAVQWIAVLALVVIAIGVSMALDAERLAHQTTKTMHAEQLAQAHAERAIEEATRRKAEQELRDAQETHAAEVETFHLDRDRALARSAVESRRVQDAANAAAARARAQCANTAASELGPSTDDAIGVLAYVLGRADARAGELADVAEQRGIAGRACERAYGEARATLKAN